MELDKICRACLSANEEMQSIFNYDEIIIDDVNIHLKEIITTCAKVEINENDGLPMLICQQCVRNANIAFVFKQQCERADTKLRLYIGLPPLQQQNILNLKIEQNESSTDSFNIEEIILEPKVEIEENESFEIKMKEKRKTIPRKINSRKKKFDKVHASLQSGTELDETSQPLYACNECVLCFTELQDLRRHIKSDHSKHKFVCEECNQIFSQAQTLARHVKIHQDHQKTKMCTFCGKCFQRADDLKRHIRIHTGERPYSCHQCPKAYKQSSELKEHLKSHSGEKHYMCTVCGKSLSTRNGLYVHMKVHRGEKNHQCQICGNKYVTSGELTSHVNHIHSQTKRFTCTYDDCTRAFVTKVSLDTHLRTHTGEKPFKCIVCDKSLATASSLHEHKRTHTGVKPKQCTICERRLGNSQALKKHMRIHTGERPYPCTLCSEKFICSSTLNIHMKTKHLEKEHKCDICDKKFALATRLRQHKKLHNEEKVFICAVCGDNFNMSMKLDEHMETHAQQTSSLKPSNELMSPELIPQLTIQNY